jgi:CBS domain-containing protein
MTKARDIMTEGAEHLAADDTVSEAAQRLARSDVGAVPVCNDEGRLEGIVTDRDLVVKVLAAGKDPEATRLGDIADQAEVVTIGADDDVEEALRTMAEHKVRRLPVIDGHTLVGVVSQADLAKNVEDEKVGDLVEAISAAP